MPARLGPLVLAAAALAALAAMAAAAVVTPELAGREIDFVLVAVAVAAVSGIALLALADPAVTFSLAIAATALSGNAYLLGFPIGPDRLLFAYGLVLLAWRRLREGPAAAPIRFSGVHWVLLIAAAYATISAAWAGSLVETTGFFGLLDRFGIVPFAMFLLAPVIFRTEAQRRVLLATLVALGAYLGFTAVAEYTGAGALVFPRYILDPSLGIHFGRARGPFLESVANGLALQACGVAAALAVAVWREPLARGTAAVVLALCGLGILLTLTRAVWAGTALAAAVTLLWVPQLRRYALPAAVAAAVIGLAAFALVPGLAGAADARTESRLPLLDRLNTNAAAVRMLEERPLLGVGWERARENVEYLRQADYPLTGVGLAIHNVFLSHAAELGLIGFALWFAGFAWAMGGALLRRGPPELEPWRRALAPLLVGWVTAASFGPLGYALPTLVLWTWAGVVWGGRR